MDAYKRMLGRIGTFFLVVGVFLFVLFVSSDLANVPEFDYLFLSMLCLGLSWLFGRAGPRGAAAGRFAWWNKRRQDARDRREGKGKDKEKK